MNRYNFDIQRHKDTFSVTMRMGRCFEGYNVTQNTEISFTKEQAKTISIEELLKIIDKHASTLAWT